MTDLHTDPGNLQLPPGLTHRPLRHGDEAAVTDVMAAEELAILGEVVIEEADIVGESQRPCFDVASCTIGGFGGSRLVGYAEPSGGDRGDAAIHPDYHGRGVGTALATWLLRRGREKGLDRIGMPVPSGSPGERLLTGLGFRPRWSSW